MTDYEDDESKDIILQDIETEEDRADRKRHDDKLRELWEEQRRNKNSKREVNI